MEQTARKIHKHLLNAKKIVIVPHQNPDGDAIGAAGAFAEYLRQLGKEVKIFCVTPVNEKLLILPHSQEIQMNTKIIQDREIDTIVVLDSGDLRYAGVEALVKNHPAAIINIDHHVTNEKFGAHNLVMTGAASTTEILYNYFRRNQISITPDMATALLSGIVNDTGAFTNAATGITALSVAGELLRLGANIKLAHNATWKNKSMASLKLLGKILNRLTKFEKQKLIYTYITQADLREYGVPDSESDGFANLLNNLDNDGIMLFLKETTDGKVKGSLRTTYDKIDVATIAKKMSGGGHKKAAGFTVAGTIEEALRRILYLLA